MYCIKNTRTPIWKRVSIGLKRFPFKATLMYIFLVLFLNIAYSCFPFITVDHQMLSTADVLAGIIYLVRDFVQREIRHYVIVAMLIAAAFSYAFASPVIALASVTAFALGELSDWTLFSFYSGTLSQRLLLSSCISVPLDSIVFLLVIHQLNFAGAFVMSLSKWAGVLLVWAYWARKNRSVAMG